MAERAFEHLAARWNGPGWRWWTLLAGVLLVPLTALLAAGVAELTDEAFEPLLLLFLIVEILAASLLGSGLLDSLTRKMTRGGLARESTDYVNAADKMGDLEALEERNREAQDRLTIRAGLIVLPLIITFVFFMTRI